MARKSKGRLYRRGNSETWHLEYFVNGKKIREALRDPETLDPVTDAKVAERLRRAIIEPLRMQDQAAKLRALVARADDATAAAAAGVDVSTAEAWEVFQVAELADAAARSVSDYRNNWAKFEAFWNEPERRGLQRFGPADARAFAAVLTAEQLSGGRFNKILNLCDRVFAAATDSKPLQVIRRRENVQESRRELSESEIWDVIERAAGYEHGAELRVMLLIGIYTGLRLVDAALLNVSEWDREGRRLLVTPRKTRRKGKHLVIPLHPTLATALAGCVADGEGYLLPEIVRRYRQDPPLVTRMVERALEAVGITTKKDVGTARQRSVAGFHSLRHSFVTICAANGVPLPVVQELAGHGSPAIQRQYMHMGQKETTAAIEGMPNFGAPPKVVLDLCFTRTLKTEGSG